MPSLIRRVQCVHTSQINKFLKSQSKPKSYLANKITTAKTITHRDLRGRWRTKKKRELNLWQNIWDGTTGFFKDALNPVFTMKHQLKLSKKVRLKEKLHRM